MIFRVGTRHRNGDMVKYDVAHVDNHEQARLMVLENVASAAVVMVVVGGKPDVVELPKEAA